MTTRIQQEYINNYYYIYIQTTATDLSTATLKFNLYVAQRFPSGRIPFIKF